MLGFGTLNILLLGAEIWVAHLVAPVTGDAAMALSAQTRPDLPPVPDHVRGCRCWSGRVVLAVVVCGAVEVVRWLGGRQAAHGHGP